MNDSGTNDLIRGDLLNTYGNQIWVLPNEEYITNDFYPPITGNLQYDMKLTEISPKATMLEDSQGDISIYAGIPTTDILRTDNTEVVRIKSKIKNLSKQINYEELDLQDEPLVLPDRLIQLLLKNNALVAKALLEVIVDEEISPDIAIEIFKLIGNLASQNVAYDDAEWILLMASKSDNPKIRYGASIGFMHLNNKKFLPILEKMLKREKNRYLSDVIANIMERLS